VGYEKADSKFDVKKKHLLSDSPGAGHVAGKKKKWVETGCKNYCPGTTNDRGTIFKVVRETRGNEGGGEKASRKKPDLEIDRRGKGVTT